MKDNSNLIERINGFVVWLAKGISWAIYWFVGFLGFLGFLGYFLNDPSYYMFFIFFLSFYNQLHDWIKSDKKLNIYKISIWIGSATLIISCALLAFTKSMAPILGAIIFLGLFVFLINFFSYIGMEEPKDERLRKIGSAAATHSWYFTLLIISGLLVSNLWSGEEYIRVDSLGFILIVMVATMIGGNLYFNWKGDVE